MTNALVGDLGSWKRYFPGDGRPLGSAALLRLLRARTVTFTSAIAIAACFTSALAGPSSKTDHSVRPAVVGELASAANGATVERNELRVTELQAGADAADVERVLGPPTTTATSLDGTDGEIGDYRVLVYDDEPLRPRITIESGHVTAIELDLTGISVAPLQADARRSAIPIALARTDLRIGMTPNEAAGVLGPLEYAPTIALFKGRPVFYATYSTRDGDRLASLTFTDGVLTAFSIWHRPAFTCC